MRIVFKAWQLWGRFRERYRSHYYAVLYPRQVYLQAPVTFGRDTVLRIPAGNTRAQARIGAHTTFRGNCTISLDGEGVLRIGSGTFFNTNCSITCMGSIEIGNDTLFGEGVRLYDHNHLFNQAGVLLKDQGFTVGHIRVGNNCWIGSNCVILKGVEIGDNVVIGAGCLISASIPPNMVVRTTTPLLTAPLVLRPAPAR